LGCEQDVLDHLILAARRPQYLKSGDQITARARTRAVDLGEQATEIVEP
jgi:hypothetical protein